MDRQIIPNRRQDGRAFAIVHKATRLSVKIRTLLPHPSLLRHTWRTERLSIIASRTFEGPTLLHLVRNTSAHLSMGSKSSPIAGARTLVPGSEEAI